MSHLPEILMARYTAGNSELPIVRKWMVQQELGRIVRKQTEIIATEVRILWRDMTEHVLERYSTLKKNNVSPYQTKFPPRFVRIHQCVPPDLTVFNNFSLSPSLSINS